MLFNIIKDGNDPETLCHNTLYRKEKNWHLQHSINAKGASL